MRLLYWIATIIIIGAIIKINLGDTISWGILNTNGGGTNSDSEYMLIGIPSLLAGLTAFLLFNFLFSFLFFRSFYLSILKEKTYYLKPLFFSLLLNLLVVIDDFILIKDNGITEESFSVQYLCLHAATILIYLSIFGYHLLKNRKQQLNFEWTQEKRSEL